MELQIKTGKRVYELKDEAGNALGKIAFNPGDANFVARVRDFMNYLDSKGVVANEIDRLNLEGKIDEAIDVMITLDTEIKAKLDELFDAKISEIVFGNACCLGKDDNGEYLIESFLNQILPEYKKTMKSRNNKVNQYTKGYMNDRRTSHKPRRKRR